LIEYSKIAKKQFLKAPEIIQKKLASWTESIEKVGIKEVRKNSGYHDEPLKGKRSGQRSIRLNIQWQAIYTVNEDRTITLVTIKEVTPHDY
jgi:toxin HigB-1